MSTQMDELESPETDPHTNVTIFEKGINGRGTVIKTNGKGTTGRPQAKTKNLNPTPYTNINS